MDSHARALLRRIALGLPLSVVASASSCSPTYPPCPAPVAVRVHQVTAAQLGQLDAGAPGMACTDLCRAFDLYGGLDSAGIDAGTDDAALYNTIFYTTATCDVSTTAGTPIVTCTYYPQCLGGRAPAGLMERGFDSHGVADWLARAAHLERASVPAFEELAGELRLHGAPARLSGAAIRAADDERRHAALVCALAATRGAATPPVVRVASAPRSLVAMAADNAVEGCVREAYAALAAAHQAEHAHDADIRAAYATIAADEARHALLSFAINDWTRARLAPREGRTVEGCRRAALDAWRAAEFDDDETAVALGLPDGARRAALFDSLADV